MKGSIGTPMQGIEYYKHPERVKCNCNVCHHCIKKDKAKDAIFCNKWHEWKYGDEYKKRRLCRWFFTFPDKKHGSTCTINGNPMRFLNPRLHFHIYQRKSKSDEWEYIGKVYADSEANAINKSITGKQYSESVNPDYEHKAVIHDEDIETIQTFGEDSIPKIIWKKK